MGFVLMLVSSHLTGFGQPSSSPSTHRRSHRTRCMLIVKQLPSTPDMSAFGESSAQAPIPGQVGDSHGHGSLHPPQAPQAPQAHHSRPSGLLGNLSISQLYSLKQHAFPISWNPQTTDPESPPPNSQPHRPTSQPSFSSLELLPNTNEK